jgi:hypothetical protein
MMSERRRFRRPVDPKNAGIGLCCAAHCGIGFDCENARPALGNRPRRNPGARTKIGDDERCRIESRQDRVDRSRRV